MANPQSLADHLPPDPEHTSLRSAPPSASNVLVPSASADLRGMLSVTSGVSKHLRGVEAIAAPPLLSNFGASVTERMGCLDYLRTLQKPPPSLAPPSQGRAELPPLCQRPPQNWAVKTQVGPRLVQKVAGALGTQTTRERPRRGAPGLLPRSLPSTQLPRLGRLGFASITSPSEGEKKTRQPAPGPPLLPHPPATPGRASPPSRFCPEPRTLILKLRRIKLKCQSYKVAGYPGEFRLWFERPVRFL